MCSKCKKLISIEEFHKSSVTKDGLYNWCKSCKKDWKKFYYIENKKEIRDKGRQHYQNNKQLYSDYQKLYRQVNIERCRENVNKYVKRKRRLDINFKLKNLIRCRIRSAIKRNIKCSKSSILIGCSLVFLKQYLQKTAIKNGYLDFDINNYDGKEFHIDHIIPCSLFNLRCGYHQKLCFNWSNLQILDGHFNRVKQNRMNEVDNEYFR